MLAHSPSRSWMGTRSLDNAVANRVYIRVVSARDKQYPVRLTPDERAELEALSAQAGVRLSVAFREGAREYLLARANPPSNDPLAKDLYALAAKVESRFRGGK